MLNTEISIRPATLRHMDQIVRLWGEMMTDHVARDSRVRLAEGALPAYRAYAGYHLDRDDSFLRVALEGRRVVGYCLTSISRNLPMFLPERFGYLSDLCVARQARRRGIGTALFEEVRGWLKMHGVTSIQLQYYAGNGPAEAFWKSLGFENFYTRMWLDME
jgi:ribosomal protein S18 acetylase RimI-like enzyme